MHIYIYTYLSCIMIAGHAQTSILLALEQTFGFLNLLGCHSTLTINITSGKSRIKKKKQTMGNLILNHPLKNGGSLKVAVKKNET